MRNIIPASGLKKQSPELSPLPLQHVAVIMDGNRRWAALHRLPKLSGHQEGVKTLKEIVKHTSARGLKFLTVYAFSTENWTRDDTEVNYLLELFAHVLSKELDELHNNNVKLHFIGKLDGMPSELSRSFLSATSKTKNNTGLSLQIAVNYGARLEIADAIKRIILDVQAHNLAVDDITAEKVSHYLYTENIPDPDLLIRTGGEMRLSNYLLWQLAYSELYVTDILWPDFKPEHFEKAVAEFSLRQRRYGS
jgi:undecaprenyl diphosphate synthase